MSPTSYQAALPRVIPSLLSATLIIIPYSNSFVKRVRKVFLQRKQRTKTRLLTFFEPLPVKRTMKKTRFFLPRAIVFLTFQNAPESFHWAVVNAVGYTRHALCHTRIFQHVVKSMTCVLKNSRCASGLAFTAALNVSNTIALSLCSLITYETMRLSYRSRMALR